MNVEQCFRLDILYTLPVYILCTAVLTVPSPSCEASSTKSDSSARDIPEQKTRVHVHLADRHLPSEADLDRCSRRYGGGRERRRKLNVGPS